MPPLEPWQVLLVDDHAVLREGVRLILEASGELRCAQVGTAEDALRYLDHGHALDVVALDIQLPGMSGLDALVEIKTRRPGLPVLILSMHPEEQLALRALRLGARGYLSKRAHPGEIRQAVLALAQGGSYFPPRIVALLAKHDVAVRPLHEALSNREFEIMRMIGTGKTVTEISEILGLSVKTVSTYRERLLRKMNMGSTQEIMRYVLQEGL